MIKNEVQQGFTMIVSSKFVIISSFLQMCVVRRTSDKCWYRARVQNVLQTLCGPQAR